MTRWIAAMLLCVAAGPQDTQARPAGAALTDDEKIVHLLNRLTPGATPALVAEVKAAGLRPWLARQLEAGLEEPAALADRLAKFESLELPTAEIIQKYDTKPGKAATPAEKREAHRQAMIPPTETLTSIVLRAAYSANGVREVAADFFRNHFAVSIEKGEVRFLIVDWEREVIRKHALGRFGDMLVASAKNPAMLFFLDNALSRKPPTDAELKAIENRTKRRTGSDERAEEAVDLARERGLNENYARELMELHTLGVDNVYTQNDVIEVAKCLTGWTISKPRTKRGSFEFVPFMHCEGDKTVLGHVIRSDPKNGLADGEKVLDLLQGHEGTARFLSWKLCRWLVNDVPDPAMVDRVARVFRDSGGDIPKVIQAIVDDPLFFDRANYRAKFKRPWEFVVSALRVTGANVSYPPLGLQKALKEMNEPLYQCADPTGYYDQAEAWCDPGAMATRWTFANDLVSGRLNGVRIPASFYEGLPTDSPQELKKILVERLLPVSGIGGTTAAALDTLAATPGVKPTQLVAFLLGSPEFQRQ